MPRGDGTGPGGGGRGAGKGMGKGKGQGQGGGQGQGRGRGQGQGPSRGQGRGLMGGPLAAGPGGECVCAACGERVPHVAGQPCSQQTCPKCGAQMTRQ